MRVPTTQKCLWCGKTGIKPVSGTSLGLNSFEESGDAGPMEMRVTDNNYGVVPGLGVCRHCRHVQQSPLSSDNFLHLYEGMEDPLYLEEEESRRWVFRNILNRLGRFKKGGKLLDIGAFTGLFLEEAKIQGYQVSGIEPSKWACERASSLFRLKLFQGPLESFPKSKGLFDVITLLDVIEHVEKPKGLLQEVFNRLKPGGIMVLVTPDYSSLASKILKDKWWHIRMAHLSYFQKGDLLAHLEKMGFDLIQKRPYAWGFTLKYWLSRLEKWTPISLLICNLEKMAPFLLKIKIPMCFFDSVELYLKKRIIP